MKDDFMISIEENQFTPFVIDSIVHLMIFDTDFLKKCVRIVEATSFKDERYVIADLCYKFFHSYKKAPQDYILSLMEEFLHKRPSKAKIMNRYLLKIAEMEINKEYVLDAFNKFAKDSICRAAIEQAQYLVDKGSLDKAQKVILSKFKQAYTLNKHKIENVIESDGTFSDEEEEVNVRSFIEPYDKTVGGFVRPEMILTFGDSNVGKSWNMVHYGKAAILQGKNILHITLETSEKIIKKRYAASITGTTFKRRIDEETEQNVRKFSSKVYRKKLAFLKRRGSKLWIHQAIQFSLQDLYELVDSIELMEECVPDVIIIDSPDQMVSDFRYKDKRYEERELYQRLLDFSKERNVTLHVTTQAQRKAGEAIIVIGKHVGEAYDKFRTVDTCFTLTQSEAMYKKSKFYLFHAKSRDNSKFMLMECKQALHCGQYIISAKEISIRDVLKKEE